MPQPPKILFSELTQSFYVVTKHKQLSETRFNAIEKFDVTEEMQVFLDQAFEAGKQSALKEQNNGVA